MKAAKAVEKLKYSLQTAGGKNAIDTVSAAVKWGQPEFALDGLGNIRKFMIKYPEVFRLEGASVILQQSGSSISPETQPGQQKRSSELQSSDAASKKHKGTSVTVVNDSWWASEDAIEGVDLLVGQYQAESYKHDGHEVFKKNDLTEGPIFLFYWKGRDGWDKPSWWFSNEVGSESAWAYAEGEGFLPSSKGWQVPVPGSPQLSGLRIQLSELGGAAQQKSDKAASSKEESKGESWDKNTSWNKSWKEDKGDKSTSWNKSWKEEDKGWEQKKEAGSSSSKGSSWDKSWKKDDAGWEKKDQEAASSSSWSKSSWKKDAKSW